MAKIVKDAIYKQVAADIREGITDTDSPRWRPGDMLPPEAALKAEYDVSSTTIRQALMDLRTEGLIVIRNGIGAFVSASYGQPATTIDRTAEAPAFTPTGEATQFRIKADAPMAALLGIPENEPLFVVEVSATEEDTGRKVLIRRIIPIDATDGHAPDPDADTATLLAMLTKRNGKPTKTEYVRARMPTPDEREALGTEPAVPIFETTRVHTTKGRTIFAETQRTSTEGVQLAYPVG